MAPSRGKGKARASATSTPARRTPRSTRKAKDDVPHVYQDMLAEAAVVDPTSESSDRPLKKRRLVMDPSRTQRSTGTDINRTHRAAGQHQQTVEDSSEDEDESDFAFEDIDLEQRNASSPAEGEEVDDDIADISVSVDPTSTPKRTTTLNRRKPASVAEKAFRLLVHKAQVLCLLGHCMYINGWCKNVVVQRHLKPLLSKKTLSYLNPKTVESQFQRNRSFMDGLQQASEAWRGAYKVNASGLRRARWDADVDGGEALATDETDPIDRAEFIAAAKNLEGSQDCGNQLFCALLRSAGVEARLVSSLQPLPFANVSTKSSTPQKLSKPTVFAMASGTDSPASDSNTEDSSIRNSSTIGKVPSARRRIGQPAFVAEPSTTSTLQKQKKSIRKLTFPVFWVEAFNAAHQKWIAVDPIVTQTVSKPSKLEPPSSYEWNQLTYAIAFESDGVARDVTKRYAKAFNAKTRRQRVESTENGAAWLRKTLRIFRRRGGALDREQLEDAELAQREAREGLPGNVQDFKEHPYYALERHLKRNEVIQPKREVGKVNAGTTAKPRMEVVYRRQDVCVCRSAERWFRVGHEVIEGEQPLKRVPARRVKAGRPDEDEEEEGRAMTALYGAAQTRLYVPPPVVKAKVPRNAFGNLDVYVPSMVPAGGAHVRHPLAKEAARALKVDAVDAVTGFQFKGRQGSAVVEGVVVAEEYAEAVSAIIDGLQEDQVEEEGMARSALALRMWRRFLTGLRIKERVSQYGNEGGDEDMGEAEEGGGFLQSEIEHGEEALPTAGRFSLAELSKPSRAAKRTKKKDVSKESEEEEEFEEDEDSADHEDHDPTPKARRSRRRVVDDESEDDHMPDYAPSLPDTTPYDTGAGGFVPDEAAEDESGGGFVPEDGKVADGDGGFQTEEDDASQRRFEHALGDVVDDNFGGGFFPDQSQDHPVQDQAIVATTADSAPEPEAYAQSTKFEDSDGPTNQAASGKGPVDAVATANTPYHITYDLESLEDVGEKQQNTPTQLRLQGQSAQANIREEENEVEESDRGSMLSHDPEDEDAEPDWLESD